MTQGESARLIAEVAAVWRYPVKSMQGEGLEVCAVTARGLFADRSRALVDVATGKVVSLKRPAKWRALLECRASLAPSADNPLALRIELPDGDIAQTGDPRLHERLSRALGREVRLTATPPDGAAIEKLWPSFPGFEPSSAPTDGGDGDGGERVTTESLGVLAPGTFFDAAPVHFITESTLAALRAHRGGDWDARRFRPNLVLRCDTPGFAEDGWVGRSIAIGSSVALRVVVAAPRCVVPTLPQSGLSDDRDVLRVLLSHRMRQEHAKHVAVVGEAGLREGGDDAPGARRPRPSARPREKSDRPSHPEAHLREAGHITACETKVRPERRAVQVALRDALSARRASTR